jgi:hypothetical protein
MNGEQWKEGHAVGEIHVFDRIYMFASESRREC